jgi:acetolactate synthase-1/2/3 large subunit
MLAMAEKKMVNGGELAIRTLKQAAVTDVFVLHGGHIDPIFQACLDHDIRVIDTRHEAAAGHAADGYARQTGKIGVAVATAGPGYTNVITAMTQAYLDCSPVLFIIGASPLRDTERWPLQGGFDQVAMAVPVTKWAKQVTSTTAIPHMTAQAIREATSGQPGPVMLEIPIDVMYNQVDESSVSIPETITVDAAPAPAPQQVEQIVKMLQSAKRPVMVAGGGTLFSRAHEELREFAELSGIPVFTNNKARGMIPTDHPLSGHSLTNIGLAMATGAGAPDVALFLGARFGMFTGGDRIPPADCAIIQVDINGRELGRIRNVDVPVVADCRETLAALCRVGKNVQWPDWNGWSGQIHELGQWHQAAYKEAVEKSPSLHPYEALTEVMNALDKDAIVCADGGESSQWADLLSRGRNPGAFTGHGYLGCLGYGMPYAMGAKVAHPDRQVVCIAGDGAAGINIQEFDTMVRHDLPVVTVILNNKAWGMVLHDQQRIFGSNRIVGTALGESRYEKVAEGFCCHGEYIEKASEIGPAMERAFKSGLPACLNIVTNLDAVFGDTKGEKIRQSKSDSEIAMPYYDNLKKD